MTDVYGLPVSRITYSHHPNDHVVAAYVAPRLEAIFGEMGFVADGTCGDRGGFCCGGPSPSAPGRTGQRPRGDGDDRYSGASCRDGYSAINSSPAAAHGGTAKDW